MYPKMQFIYCFLKEWNLLYLRTWGEGGGGCIIPTLFSIQLYYYVIAIYKNMCNIYHIFVYVYIISLVVICFKQAFLYHGGYSILNV